MLPLEVKRSWAFLVMLLLMCGTQHSGDTCDIKNLLLVSVAESQCQFTAGFKLFNGWNMSFVYKDTQHLDGRQTEGFNCNITITSTGCVLNLTLDKDALSKQNIVVMTQPFDNNSCVPSMFQSGLGFPSCFTEGGKNYLLSQDCKMDFWNTLKPGNNSKICTDLPENCINITVSNCNIDYRSCNLPGQMTNRSSASTATTTASTVTTTITTTGSSSTPATTSTSTKTVVTGNTGTVDSTENAREVMRNLSSYLEMMGNATTASLKIGNITGVMTKLSNNSSNISVGIATNGDMKLLKDNEKGAGLSYLVHIPAEAIDMAKNRNGSFAGILLFPGIKQTDTKSFFLNDEIVGIDMGAQINNLSHTINIEYINVNKKGNNVSCRSWNGAGNSTWVTDGCETVEANGSITCQCSHLTFFALLMSPPANISASDYKSLTYITSIGCGLSMFFLAVGLYMHCFIRKGTASQATKILMNLFVAMFILNLSFVVNESIANLGIYGACVATAALMHYTMLATFSWFFMEALHMYLNLRWSPNEIKHYMMKICISGWVTPAIVVITLLALSEYGYLTIFKDDGTSSKMCWISNSQIHQWVNISYYAIVFIFTLSMFIITVKVIVAFKPVAKKAQQDPSVKSKTFSILSLFFLLGITWAFAFFSYGPMTLAAYYIFTILNSFQGFFLFIYYYNTSKPVEDGKNVTHSSSTLKTVVSSPT